LGHAGGGGKAGKKGRNPSKAGKRDTKKSKKGKGERGGNAKTGLETGLEDFSRERAGRGAEDQLGAMRKQRQGKRERSAVTSGALWS